MDYSYNKKIRACFSDESCNTGRQYEIDLAKAIVAFCLAGIHIFVLCCTDAELDEYGVPYIFDSILGGPFAAPMFMFVMGIGLTYSRNNNPPFLIRRGLKLVALGFLLNVCRYLIPNTLGYFITGDSAFYLDPLPFYFFGNDIWIFAGLAHILMAFFQKNHVSPGGILISGVVLNAVGMSFCDVATGVIPLDIFLGHFIGIESDVVTYISDFPLLQWFVVYSSGYFFGFYLRRLKDKETFYKWFAIP
ncbi:MAG: DUF1624 domain-containing protein, partial [Lachnospiraceae bacterium]|nr:DUF1624 domain-containing protein [Lachnospiraceae bacterium]